MTKDRVTLEAISKFGSFARKKQMIIEREEVRPARCGRRGPTLGAPFVSAYQACPPGIDF